MTDRFPAGATLIARVADRRADDGRHVDCVELSPDQLGSYEPWDGLRAG